jgi:ribosome-associated protein
VNHIAIHEETSSTALAAAAAIDDKKGLHITLLDVSGLIVLTDVFIIATGTSRRHVMTLAEETEMQLKSQDRRPLRREGMDDGTWVLLDYGDVIVHVFDAETRDYYDLERLWADAPRLAFEPAAS